MSSPESSAELPPMLRLYQDYKRRYPDCILMMQVGDFYELFFDDAVTVSRTLNLTLTSRDKNSENPTPMCGVPVAAVDGYIERLVDKGFSVAVVRQVEDLSGKKSKVDRQLERLVTPGIRVLAAGSSHREESVVAAVSLGNQDDCAILFGDFSRARLFVREGISLAQLCDELKIIAPVEILLPDEVDGKAVDRRSGWVRELERAFGARSVVRFRRAEVLHSSNWHERRLTHVPGYTQLSPSARRAAHLLVAYADEVTAGAEFSLVEISPKHYERVMGIDPATRSHLELVRNERDGSLEGTLLQYMDCSVTLGGFRLLREWILHPLLDVSAINSRLDAIDYFIRERNMGDEVRSLLKHVPDLLRILTRSELDAVLPRELAALRDGIEAIGRIGELLAGAPAPMQKAAVTLVEVLGNLVDNFIIPAALGELLRSTLLEIPAAGLNEGGIIRTDFDPELKRLTELKTKGRSLLIELEASERQATGISSLKVRFNNVFGYYIEVTKPNLSKVPDRFRRKQTTVNGERFITEELKVLEDELLGAETKVAQLERELFAKLREDVKPFVSQLRNVAEKVSELDVLCCLAELAQREGLSRPTLNESRDLLVRQGKHPVLARSLGNSFVPNDVEIHGEEHVCVILTGPNMGGKSTYLRQTALLVIMAQLGSYIPAQAASLGVVDRIFTRIGASDNMAEGESTFMVEMREASYIVQAATERSLIIIDEVGRGTATADGLSIAQAILEWIVVEVRCRTLFATHFHELTSLEKNYYSIQNASVGSVDHAGEIIFTHQITPGPASRSYGLEVAKLAGLPAAVLARARTLLAVFDRLQGEDRKGSREVRQAQLSFFPQAVRAGLQVGIEKFKEPEDYQALKRLEGRLKALDVNRITPIEALILLQELQRMGELTEPDGVRQQAGEQKRTTVF